MSPGLFLVSLVCVYGSSKKLTTSAACLTPGVDCAGSMLAAYNALNRAGTANSAGYSTTLEKSPGVNGITNEVCQAMLDDRMQGFNDLNAALDVMTLATVPTVQSSLEEAEQTVLDIKARHTEYTTKLISLNEMMLKAQDRAKVLLTWENDESVMRGSLADAFNDLETSVISGSSRISTASKHLRDMVKDMQVLNDKVTQITLKVGDALTNSYKWAFNATDKINNHADRIANLNEEMKIRFNQVEKRTPIANDLLALAAQIVSLHPEAVQEGYKMLTDQSYLESQLRDVITTLPVPSGFSPASPTPPTAPDANSPSSAPPASSAPTSFYF